MIVETGHTSHPYLAHTPTMQVPLNIRNTQNVYNAMWYCVRDLDPLIIRFWFVTMRVNVQGYACCRSAAQHAI